MAVGEVGGLPGTTTTPPPQALYTDTETGATPLDFAYAVHTEIGDTTVGARINGQERPLRTVLEHEPGNALALGQSTGPEFFQPKDAAFEGLRIVAFANRLYDLVGAPVAFEVTKVTPGNDHDGALDVKAYNFSDKKVAAYGIMMRYTDKDGAPVKVKVGTPFEKDHDSWSMSGMKFKCDPTSWCDYEIDHLDVPAAATKAEVVAHSVRALADDGVKFAEPDLWTLEGGGLHWPADPK